MLLHWLLLLLRKEALCLWSTTLVSFTRIHETMAGYLSRLYSEYISRTFHGLWQFITKLLISLVDFYEAAAKHCISFTHFQRFRCFGASFLQEYTPFSYYRMWILVPALLTQDTKGPIHQWTTCDRKIREICIIITFLICLIFIYMWYLIQGVYSDHWGPRPEALNKYEDISHLPNTSAVPIWSDLLTMTSATKQHYYSEVH